LWIDAMVVQVFRICSQFKTDRAAVSAIEYALLTGFVAVAIISGASILGGRASGTLNDAASKFQTSSNTAPGAAGTAPTAAPGAAGSGGASVATFRKP